jgi:hypothetical protein
MLGLQMSGLAAGRAVRHTESGKNGRPEQNTMSENGYCSA